MRKQVSGNAKVKSKKPASKHPNHLDDKEIREFLIDSHPDFQEDFLDSSAPNAGAILILLLQSRGESSLADPTRRQKDSHLSIYWKLFVQKRILGFEQELFPLLDWKRI